MPHMKNTDFLESQKLENEMTKYIFVTGGVVCRGSIYAALITVGDEND